MPYLLSRTPTLATFAALVALAGCTQPAQAPSQVVTQYNPPAAVVPGPNVTHYQVAFASNSTSIDAAGQQAIATAGDALRGNATMTATVVGRADALGSDARNMRLSKQRATKVANALLQTGDIAAARVDVRWTGKRQQGDQAPASTSDAGDRVVDITIHQ